MTLDMLETLGDEELQAVIDRSRELMQRHDRERKDKALAEARSLLSAAGLTLKDVAAKGRGGATKSPVYKGGRLYRHPSKPELTWNAKGQKPNWLRDLEKQGMRAVEKTAKGESA